MRSHVDVYNLTNYYAAEYNPPVTWPTWYPGSKWVESNLEPTIHLAIHWMFRNWTTSIPICLAYIVAVFLGQYAMRDRKPFNLKWTLITWNAALALFSAVGTYVIAPPLLHSIWKGGLTAGLCDLPEERRVAICTWAILYVWSKVAEFGDTVFLVLRKRPVINLHWIHHAATCFGSFYSVHFMPAMALQVMVINFGIHAFMYAYYGARAAGINVPTKWAKWITRFQLAQMGVNWLALIFVYGVMEWTNRPCHNDPELVYFGLGIFTLFGTLFANFFIRSYYGPGKSKKAMTQVSK